MVSSISRSAPAPAQKPSAPHYNALLTPFLHRRFVRAFSITLSVCFIEAILTGSKKSFFWTLFPIGPTGIKALLFAGTVLPLLILRVAQLHVPSRGGASPMHIFIKLLVGGDILRTVGTYCLSAFTFTQLYMWLSDSSANLGISIQKSSFERQRLNERYVYMLFFALYSGAVSGSSHLLLDRDFLDFFFPKSAVALELESHLPRSTIHVGLHALFTAITGPLVYLFFRRLMWTSSLFMVKFFYRLHRDESLQEFPIGFGLLIRSLWISFLLSTAWEASNVAFSVYFTQGPVKDGKTISERSSDPNGSLVWGLKMKKKPLTQATAFLELSYIAQNCPPRRISIFKDIRSPTCIWDQIAKECLEVIGEIPKALATPAAAPVESPVTKQDPKVEQRPDSRSPDAEKPFKQVSDKNVWRTPPKEAPLRNWQATSDRIPTSPLPLGKIAVPMEKLELSARGYLDHLLTNNFESLFRMTIHDRTSLVLPNPTMQRDAIIALTRFSCFSLEEDEYGLVQKTLPQILSAFDAAMRSLETFLAHPPTQWMEVDFKKDEKTILPKEPDMLLGVLRSGMVDIGNAFGPYMKDLKLSNDVTRRLRNVCAGA